MRLKGSYTVEAALLMTVIVPLLTGVIYLGFYLHNEALMQNAAYELAVLEGLQEEEETVRQRKQQLVSEAFLGLRRVSADVRLEEKRAVAEIHGTFEVPGLVMRFFGGNQIKMEARCELARMEPGKAVSRIHLLKRLAAQEQEEAEDEHIVSPGQGK